MTLAFDVMMGIQAYVPKNYEVIPSASSQTLTVGKWPQWFARRLRVPARNTVDDSDSPEPSQNQVCRGTGRWDS